MASVEVASPSGPLASFLCERLHARLSLLTCFCMATVYMGDISSSGLQGDPQIVTFHSPCVFVADSELFMKA